MTRFFSTIPLMKISATVVQGVQIGAKFGIATANLLLEELPEIKEGVYLVKVQIREKKKERKKVMGHRSPNLSLRALVDPETRQYQGLLHFGPRKTFGGDFSAEVHILDFEKDIYGQKITIELVKKIREVRAFKNADALFTQIETDVLVSRKYFLRESVRQAWKTQSLSDQENLAATAVRHLSSNLAFLEASKVFCYAPQLGKEITFMAGLMKAFPDKKYFFPRVEGDQMQFYPVSRYTDLVAMEYGILAPEKTISASPIGSVVMLVPSVAMDEDKNRLGQGGGFYDKYLSTLKEPIRTLAVVPRFAVVEKVPTEAHDKPIDELIVCEL